ncbi:centromere protein U isoform X2 [Syngnathus scovelli]|uniref:centromere protein U isoform X2 n=1 Tax=Syngnathus scovelli TaxID=161590 RepID=UPI0021101811|nr:centromere protein U isoform X2 [Syngnathus scovelli]
MSTRKSRSVKVAPVAPVGNKKSSSLDSGNQSTIGSASFLEGLQEKNGNPLHSTAIEDDLNLSKEPQKTKSQVGKNVTKKVNEVVKTRPQKNEPAKIEKKRGSQEESDTVPCTKRRQNQVLSSDGDTDEDTSWNPSRKKAKIQSLERPSKKLTRDKVQRNGKKRKKSQGGTELEVVMEAFLNFCDEYRDSVESNAVKKSIDCFSNSVKEQLLEKMASNREFKALKRENSKVSSMIRTKTQQLLDAKHELIRAERLVDLLQKEKNDLKLRLEDLRRSQAFLKDIRELTQVYLDYRTAHPKEKETYGTSSVAAQRLET